MGFYVDAAKSIVPSTAIVAEIGASYHPEEEPFGEEREAVALGGLRFHFVRRPTVRVFGQILAGLGSHRQRFSASRRFENLQSGGAVQYGLGVGIPIGQRWGVQVRADIRAISAGDGFLASRLFTIGIVRMWGRS